MRAARSAILLASLSWTMCFGAAQDAEAENGACGLETGIWASPHEACQYARQPEEANKKFGQDALLEWRLGYYRFEGANCTIFSHRRQMKQCTLSVECSYQKTYTTAEWSIEVETDQQFRFGDRPDSPIYYHCPAGDAPPP